MTEKKELQPYQTYEEHCERLELLYNEAKEIYTSKGASASLKVLVQGIQEILYKKLSL